MVKSNIVDVELFIFGMKDACCKRIDVGIVKAVTFKININWCEQRGVVTIRTKISCVMEGNVVFNPLNMIIILIKLKSALVKEVCSKYNIIAKTHGVNDHRVFIDNHVSIEVTEK